MQQYQQQQLEQMQETQKEMYEAMLALKSEVAAVREQMNSWRHQGW